MLPPPKGQRDYAAESEYVDLFGSLAPNPKTEISRSTATVRAVHKEGHAGCRAYGYVDTCVGKNAQEISISRARSMVEFVHGQPELSQLQSIVDTKEGVKYCKVLECLGVPEERTLLLIASSPIHAVVSNLAARISRGHILVTGSPSLSSFSFVLAFAVFFPSLPEQLSKFCLSSLFTSPSVCFSSLSLYT
jgi:hypothetical protein